ncbi:hypothetical protein D3248_05930 [Leucobacter zeae]|nr:hypothetical protein [Leucobacter zeae]
MSGAGLLGGDPDGTEPGALDAIVLAGGRGSRLGGVDKAAVELGGARLVDRAVAAARAAGAAHVVVVGPESARAIGTTVVREDPPFAGPLAALAAALPVVEAPRLLLLSCDLVDPALACRALLEADAVGRGEWDGRILVDPAGRMQWLAGLYRTEALRSGIAGCAGGVRDAPLRRLFVGLDLLAVAAPESATADIDDPEDLARARAGIDAGAARRDEDAPARGAAARGGNGAHGAPPSN